MEKSTLSVLGLPAFKDNYIWVLRGGGDAVVVDPGTADPVLEYLARSGDRLRAILLTHHHADHVGGVAELLQRLPAAPAVYGPATEAIAGVDHPLQGGETIRIGPMEARLTAEFTVIPVPGHTRGHLAYHAASIDPAGALFCGDTLFGAGCGRLFEGTPAQMQDSLARIAVLPAPTLVYCAHEYTQANLRFAGVVEPHNPAIRQRSAEVAARREAGLPTVPDTLGRELDTNPFLRWRMPAVIAAAEQRLGRSPQSAVETFAAIREWRNGF